MTGGLSVADCIARMRAVVADLRDDDQHPEWSRATARAMADRIEAAIDDAVAKAHAADGPTS